MKAGYSKYILGFVAERWGRSILIFFLGFLSQFLTILIPVSLGKYYELAFDLHSQRLHFLTVIPDGLWNTIPRYLGFLVVLISIRFVAHAAYQYVLRMEAEELVKSLKDRLFTRQVHIRPEVYRNLGTGKFLLRYSGDIRSVKNLYLKGGIPLLINILVMGCAIAWMFALSPLGFTVLLAGGLVSLGVLYLLNRKIEAYSLEYRNLNSGQLSYVSRVLRAITDVATRNQQPVAIKRYGKRTEKIRAVATLLGYWKSLNSGFISFAQYSVLTGVLLAFYTLGVQGMGSANLISFVLLFITVRPVLRTLMRWPTVLKMGRISLGKLERVFELEMEELDKGKVLRVRNPRLSIEGFAVGGGLEFTFRTRKRAYNAIFLPTYTSSLSLVRALLRLDDTYGGALMLNGRDIREYSPRSLRDTIGVASGDHPLTGRTVYEAVVVSRSPRSRELAERAIQQVKQCYLLPEGFGLDSRIGENGALLTPLEKEAVSLARGICEMRPILVFQGFRYLDPESLIQQGRLSEKALVLHFQDVSSPVLWQADPAPGDMALEAVG
ncbi:ABC transporter transmembrane domain-containing protein [Robiginitalea sediminis]|uniref:ABC transporter transmembrane domain-containing protein n=1 Tax=Robiginitalea sediminis TaxID=1982593 RepID=UPI001303E905|nr:ABC transporter ATP-binding protein [Robiginitalea sediminis]